MSQQSPYLPQPQHTLLHTSGSHQNQTANHPNFTANQQQPLQPPPQQQLQQQPTQATQPIQQQQQQLPPQHQRQQSFPPQQPSPNPTRQTTISNNSFSLPPQAPRPHLPVPVSAPSARSTSVLSSELIQEYLDENEVIISCIVENQNMGKMNACAEYQKKLQSNLFFLASLADQANQQAQQTAMQDRMNLQHAAAQQHHQQQQQQQLQQHPQPPPLQQQHSPVDESNNGASTVASAPQSPQA